MRILKRLLVGLVIVVLALVVIAYLLPREVTVARSVTIDAPAEEVFPHVNSMQKTEAWSPWLERDPDVKLSYDGPEMGVGNTLVWESENPQVGTGRQTITASAENARVDTDLDFGPMGTANAWFILDPAGEATEVTWGFRSDMGMNPVARWMGLMMDRWVGGDYERGLQNLKAVVEAG